MKLQDFQLKDCSYFSKSRKQSGAILRDLLLMITLGNHGPQEALTKKTNIRVMLQKRYLIMCQTEFYDFGGNLLLNK